MLHLFQEKKNNQKPNFFSFLFSLIPELLQSWVLLAIFLKAKPSLCSSPRPTQESQVWRRSCQRFWMCLIQWEFSIHSHETKFSPQICCCSNKWGVLSCGFPYSDIQTWHRWVYLWMIRNKSTEQSPRKKWRRDLPVETGAERCLEGTCAAKWSILQDGIWDKSVKQFTLYV